MFYKRKKTSIDERNNSPFWKLVRLHASDKTLSKLELSRLEKKILYLDIDGVLIHDSLKSYGKVASGITEFLKVVTRKYNCYWLTTHCYQGENHVVEFLSKKLSPEEMQYVPFIKPSDWKTWKTEAINFKKDFIWIDDDPQKEELKELQKNNCENKIILVDLEKSPNRLKELAKSL